MGSQSILGGHGGYIVKEAFKETLSHSLKESPGFFHNFTLNVASMTLSHSLRLLSQSSHQCNHNVPSEFFWMYSQQTLNIIQFYYKLSKKSLNIWLGTLWLHWWLLCERSLNEWLRVMLATLRVKLWKNPGNSFKEWLRGPLMGSFTMYPPCPPRILCDPISGYFLKAITIYPLEESVNKLRGTFKK